MRHGLCRDKGENKMLKKKLILIIIIILIALTTTLALYHKYKKEEWENSIYETINILEYEYEKDAGMELWSYLIEENKNFPAKRFDPIFAPHG